MLLHFNLLDIIFCWSFSEGFLSDDEYKKMPPLYIFKDYEHCKNVQGKYCKAEIALQPLDKNNISETWKIIEKTKPLYYFNHSQIYRGACYQNKPDKSELEQIITTNFSSDGLLPTITSLYCFNEQYIYDSVDFVVAIISVIILFLTTLATYKDLSKSKLKHPSKNNNTVLMAFSLRSNWISATTSRRKYAFVEGLRAYTISGVIFIHTFILYLAFYIENTEFFEKLFLVPLVLPFSNLLNFLVQAFFVLSAMFLGIQIMELYNANKEFTFKDLILMVINRYLRYLPHHAYLLLLYVNTVGPKTANGILNDMIEKDYHTCRNNWYYTLFLVNNWLPSRNMCGPLTWFLAVDFQMYITVTVVCYICYKFKFNLYKTFGILSISVIVANVIHNYKNNYEIVFHVNPSSYGMSKEAHDPQFWSLYLSTYSNAAAYMTAACFGFLTIDFKNSNILDNKFVYFLWHVISFGLPCLAVALTQISTDDQIIKSILGSTVKPIYALGFCFLVTGMIVEENTWLHKFFTWEPLVFFGTMTYSIYMFHFGGLIAGLGEMKKPIHITTSSFILKIISDQIASVTFGLIAYFLFEKPFGIIQKHYIPNVKKKQEQLNSL